MGAKASETVAGTPKWTLETAMTVAPCGEAATATRERSTLRRAIGNTSPKDLRVFEEPPRPRKLKRQQPEVGVST